jgi:hypothetical protein
MNPSPLGSEEIALTVVHDNQQPASRGRPVRLTVRKFLMVRRHVESGMTVTRSCELEGISYQIFRLRVSRSDRLQQRLKAAESVRFNRRHKEALASVMEAGHKSFIAHCWFLERCLPELYALRKVERTVVAETTGSNVTQIRILTLPPKEFAELQKEDGYVALPDGGLEMTDGNLKIKVYSQEHNERLLK